MTMQHDDPAEQTERDRSPAGPSLDTDPLVDSLDQLPPEQRRRILDALERGRKDLGGASIIVPPPLRR
ncbi:MAG: hypothetical protein U0869_07790 [Chloroflexota bacterium]